MASSLFRQRSDVKAAERDMGAPLAIVIREAIRAVRGSDVDLDDDKVGRVVQVEPLHVLVLNLDVVVLTEKPGQRRQAERREQRVLDRTPERGRRLPARPGERLSRR